MSHVYYRMLNVAFAALNIWKEEYSGSTRPEISARPSLYDIPKLISNDPSKDAEFTSSFPPVLHEATTDKQAYQFFLSSFFMQSAFYNGGTIQLHRTDVLSAWSGIRQNIDDRSARVKDIATAAKLNMQGFWGKTPIQICESADGVIALAGSADISISSQKEMASCLEQGSLSRTINIVLSGGTTMFKDFRRRLQQDLKKIVDAQLGGEAEAVEVNMVSLSLSHPLSRDVLFGLGVCTCITTRIAVDFEGMPLYFIIHEASTYDQVSLVIASKL
ncbi:hypothetical protein ACFE04_018674 [Oxalis oulophora]